MLVMFCDIFRTFTECCSTLKKKTLKRTMSIEADTQNGTYNLLVASVLEVVNNTVNHKYKYTKDELEGFTKPQLVEIILTRQEAYDKKKRTAKSPRSQTESESVTSPRKKDGIYEKNTSRMKATERMGTDYAKIEKQREVIRKLKEKKKREKEEHENSLKLRNANRKFAHDPHEKMRKVIKPSERMATDYSKIEKERKKIRALKEKNKQIRMNNENSLKYRNEHRTNNLFTDSHEKVVKVKEIKHTKPKKKKVTNKDKIADPVSKEIMETREEMKDELEEIHKIQEDDQSDEEESYEDESYEDSDERED
eukprot:586337_1